MTEKRRSPNFHKYITLERIIAAQKATGMIPIRGSFFRVPDAVSDYDSHMAAESEFCQWKEGQKGSLKHCSGCLLTMVAVADSLTTGVGTLTELLMAAKGDE